MADTVWYECTCTQHLAVFKGGITSTMELKPRQARNEINIEYQIFRLTIFWTCISLSCLVYDFMNALLTTGPRRLLVYSSHKQ